MTRIEILKIPNLDMQYIELIHETHKQIDMHCGLSKRLIGKDIHKITAMEVALLENAKGVHKSMQ